jgi:hypothetical protein
MAHCLTMFSLAAANNLSKIIAALRAMVSTSAFRDRYSAPLSASCKVYCGFLPDAANERAPTRIISHMISVKCSLGS